MRICKGRIWGIEIFGEPGDFGLSLGVKESLWWWKNRVNIIFRMNGALAVLTKFMLIFSLKIPELTSYKAKIIAFAGH
jgi:hypothetical protein